MNAKVFARGFAQGVGESAPSGSAISAAPAQQHVVSVPGPTIAFDIPPEPPTPAPVAAPRTRRNAAKRHTVQSAVSAARKADRSGRGSSSKPCHTPTRRTKRRLDTQHDDRHADGALRERLANARVNGRKAAKHGGQEIAASVDAPGKSAAGTAPMGAGCADAGACADAALPRPTIETDMSKKNSQNPAAATSTENSSPDVDKLKVPTDPAALLDGPAYVRAVAQHVDLVGASARLVVSTDEKVSKAELDRLRELIFGKGGPPPQEEEFRVDWSGFPRPNREARLDAESRLDAQAQQGTESHEFSGGDPSDHS